MTIYSLVLDALVVVIAFAIIGSAYRKGFLRSVILLTGYAASVFLAIVLGKYGAEILYQHLLGPQIASGVDKLVASSSEAITVEAAVPQILKRLPSFISKPFLAGFGGEKEMLRTLEETTGGILGNLGNAIETVVVKPIVVFLLQTVLCLLIFAVCAIIVKAIAAMFRKFYELPILGPINSILGGVIGIFEAAIVLFVLALAVSVVIALTSNELKWLNTNVIESTNLFRVFYDLKFLG